MTPCQHCGRLHPPAATCLNTGDSMGTPGAIGTWVDRCHIEALLGAGGFGAVYRTGHVHTGSVVALKVLKRALSTDAGMVERFLREAKAAAAVGSEHIVRVLDAGPKLSVDVLKELFWAAVNRRPDLLHRSASMRGAAPDLSRTLPSR